MINNLKLLNYRSYDSLNLQFNTAMTIFYGANGQGKTNILESIFFLSNTRSFRTRNDQDLIKNGKDFASIQLKTNDLDLKCVLHKKGKYFEKNQKAIPLVSQFIGSLKTIVFYPNETEIFRTSPGNRRNFMDSEISKVSQTYLNHLKNYQRLLRDRNKILKEKNIDLKLIEVIDEQLINEMIEIRDRRKSFVSHLNKNTSNFYNSITKKNHALKVHYKSDIYDDNKQDIRKRFEKQRDKDILFGVTQLGVHRDDLLFFIDDLEVFKFASQGQARLFLIAMKLGLISYIYELSQELPILLFDDVMSELDQFHQKSLLESIPNNIQTIITTTENNMVKVEDATYFYVENSKVIEKREFNDR